LGHGVYEGIWVGLDSPILNTSGIRNGISVNVGSRTPQEAAEWSEYLTTAQPTTLAKERATNWHPAPYTVSFLGIGNAGIAAAT